MIILGLGSNLGDRLAFLKKAADDISKILSDNLYSPIYESEALLIKNSPKEWNIPFLNMVIAGKTNLSPQQLLKEIKNIEKSLGRTDNEPRWSPRVIDVDILAFDDLIIDEEKLKIPHIELRKRAFFILPLADILPKWSYPSANNKTASELAKKIAKNDLLKTKRTTLSI